MLKVREETQTQDHMPPYATPSTNSQDYRHNCCCSCGKPSATVSRRSKHHRRRLRSTPSFDFTKQMNFNNTQYLTITSYRYLTDKYGKRKASSIGKFIKCIHRKINKDISSIESTVVEKLTPWTKIKLFLLLVTLSQRGGPEYWLDKNESAKDCDSTANHPSQQMGERSPKSHPKANKKLFCTLTEQIMQQNINEDYDEDDHDENYVFSSIWANFMEGLINHYLEDVIIPRSEMKVCQQLYKPMMKIISLYNEYNELMEKGERSGFLPTEQVDKDEEEKEEEEEEGEEEDDANEDIRANIEDVVSSSPEQGKLQKAQRLLWKARQDIPKTISKELTLLSEMYSTLSADEQDYELDEFVCCAEEYIELEYLPSLIDVLFANCGSEHFWKIMLILEPFFYYIEEVGDGDSIERFPKDSGKGSVDPRVVTLEKICEVAARQKWI